jgi:hypothetical protein
MEAIFHGWNKTESKTILSDEKQKPAFQKIKISVSKNLRRWI